MIRKFNLEINKILRSNILLILLFAILSIASGFILMRSHFFVARNDYYFHWSRVYELHYSILHGNLFPDVALNKVKQSGSIVMAMYPKINLYPLVILSFVTKNFLHIVYISFIFRNFFALIVGYISCFSHNKNRKISFIFTVVYTLSTLTLHYSLGADMGVSSSLIFLPLVLFGTLELLKNNKWKELTIGFSGVIMCHVITSVLCFAFIFCLILINLKKFLKKECALSLFKFLLSCVLITAIFWVPFIGLKLTNNVHMPFPFMLTGTDVNEFIASVFNNEVNHFITIVAVLGVLLEIINYKKTSLYCKQLFWISIIILVITTKFFPWNLLNNTMLTWTFQFTWRLFIVPQLLLCYLFAVNIVLLCRDRVMEKITLILITLAVVCTQMAGQKEMVDSLRNNHFDYNKILDDSLIVLTDYVPQKSPVYLYTDVYNDFLNHYGINDINKKIHVNLLGNGKFSFKLYKSTKSLKMPFLMYNDINYQVKVDGKNAKFHSDNHSQLTLGHMNKGKHAVQVIVHKSWYDYLSYVLSALGVIILAFAWIKSLILKRKNKE